MASIDFLIEKSSTYLPVDKVAFIEKAADYAAKVHDGQFRLSGEPYFEHPLNVAMILADLQLDSNAIAAALLHDTVEDCGVLLDQIEQEFGADVAKLVDGVTKLGKITFKELSPEAKRGQELRQAENLRKMLIAMAEDLRVVFIKLADRLHNMETLSALSPEKRLSIAKETMEIYAPLADRLGIWEIKWQLEDLAFSYLDPKQYSQIARLVAAKRDTREAFIARVIDVLRNEFDKAGIKTEISGRAKHLYSIYQKMQKYAAQGKEFNEIYDLLAIRVIVNTISECYAAIGVVHSLWHPIPGTFDDYIASPKPNGYQSLHTAVMCFGKTPLEVQVKTQEMHRISEYGVAAHWRYKEGASSDIHFEDKISWLRQLIDWHRELSGAQEFLDSVKTDIFQDQVFVFTPKGEIKDLPKGATPVDFAYRVHTELGHSTIGARVNGRLVPLTCTLKNGDVVEIITSKKGKGPSRDWLNADLGYVRTSHAREKIRQWFKKQNRLENIEHGREMLEKELKRLGLQDIGRDNLAKQFKYDSVDDFLAAIGYGDVSLNSITQKLAAQQPKPEGHLPAVKATTSSLQILGASNLLVTLGRCCRPVPGDSIIGYITRNRGVTVHRRDCHNVLHEDEKERLIPVEWGEIESLYPAVIHVEAWDRVGLVRDISAVVAGEKINITNMTVNENANGLTSLDFTLEIKGLDQLSRLLAKVEAIPGVTGAARVNHSLTPG
jgi:GTP pyrophosphokinase